MPAFVEVSKSPNFIRGQYQKAENQSNTIVQLAAAQLEKAYRETFKAYSRPAALPEYLSLKCVIVENAAKICL
jgi:hypothetical protein